MTPPLQRYVVHKLFFIISLKKLNPFFGFDERLLSNAFEIVN